MKEGNTKRDRQKERDRSRERERERERVVKRVSYSFKPFTRSTERQICKLNPDKWKII